MGTTLEDQKTKARGNVRPPKYRPRGLLPPAPPVKTPALLGTGTPAAINKSVVNEVSEALSVLGIESGNPHNIRTPQNVKLSYPYRKGWGIGIITGTKDLRKATHDIQALADLARQLGEPFNLFITPRTRSVSREVRRMVTGDIFVYDLSTGQFHMARFKPGMNTLVHDYPDAHELANRQNTDRRTKKTKPKRSKVTPDDIKAFRTIQGHIDEYGDLRSRLSRAGKSLGIDDIGELFEVDHLLEQRFQVALDAAGAHLLDNDNMMSKVVPRNKKIADQIPGYRAYAHVEKTSRLKKLIPHGSEVLFSPQQIWDAHARVLSELGLVQELESLKNSFVDFEPEINYRTSFPPDHFSPKKWVPDYFKKKKGRKARAEKNKRKKANARARKAATKKKEIEAQRKKKKTRLQKIDDQARQKLKQKASVKPAPASQPQVPQDRMTGEESRATRGNGVDADVDTPSHLTHGNTKKILKKRFTQAANIYGLATADATDVLIGSAEKITRVKVGFVATLVLGLIVDIMFSYLKGKLEQENARGIQRDVKDKIYEPLLNKRIIEVVEMVQSDTLLDQNPSFTNEWGYLVFGYTVVKEQQFKDISDLIVSSAGRSIPEVYIETIPSEMNKNPYWKGLLLSKRPKKKKEVILSGKRQLKKGNMVHYPFRHYLLVWDPEAASLYYKLKEERTKLKELAAATMKKAGIPPSQSKISFWSLLLQTIENYQFLTAYEAIESLPSSKGWTHLQLSLRAVDMLLLVPDAWPADRKNALMMYLGVDPFKSRADIHREKKRKREAEVLKRRMNSPLGNKFIM